MAPTPEIRETLIEMCRPFGDIEYCSVEYGKDGLYRCVVRLVEADKHPLAAGILGAKLQNDEIHLDIRLRPRPWEAEGREELLVAEEV